MAKRGKKAQSAGAAAAFIAMIAGFILLYMLLIPPAERNALLGDGTDSGGGTGKANTTKNAVYQKVVLTESPGRIDYLKFSQYDHPLSSVNLYTSTNGRETQIADSVYVKNGVFDKLEKNITFEITNPELIDNVYMTFKINQNMNSKGRLTANLNGNIIYDRELGKSLDKPFAVPKKYLKKQNILHFSVEGVGWRFWTTNEYELDNLKIIFDQMDTSAQSSKNTIMITDAEKFNLERAKLKFNPECTPSQVGTLSVTINNNLIFSGVPDCGILNTVELSSSVLEAGNNKIVFETERGYYLIDSINLQTQLKQMTYPVYYFDIDETLFNTNNNDDKEDEECGDVDGVCPGDCPSYLDKDCCLSKSSRYWCDILPNNENDRCRAVAYADDCSSCASGYEDSAGDPPSVCEGLCGDDTDGNCRTGCNKFYDKDCCFSDSDTNYWCNDVPKYGLSNVCKAAIHEEDCINCPSGYDTDEGTFTCPTAVTTRDEKSMLKSSYNVLLKLKFLNDGERKAAKVFVNGYQFYVDTTKDTYERKINTYVEDGSNAVKIEPDRTTLEIIKMEIEVRQI